MVDMEKREYPKPYIERAIKMIKNKTYPFILEIGCCRQNFSHDVDRETCFGCCDGHSTYLFARTRSWVDSVDINPDHISVAKMVCSNYKNVTFHNIDAIEFAKNEIIRHYDLLFLDAWDVDMPECAEKHLEFYNVFKDKISDKCLILIDDTDLYYDQEKKEYFPDPECLSGKGKLLIPRLIEDGYEIVFKGRQTLLRKS